MLVTAGGRIDLLVESPARVDTGGGTAVVVAPAGTEVEAETEPTDRVDLLSYGSPVPLSFDPEQPDRRFTYEIGRRIAFVDGQPGFWWTINGRLFPDVPMFHVEEGDVVRMTIHNDSGDVHPMHLHGHHAIVLSRDGVAATGSPWVVDSLNVGDGETYEIVFLADNPGIWMDHCHHLDHAAERARRARGLRRRDGVVRGGRAGRQPPRVGPLTGSDPWQSLWGRRRRRPR